MIAGHTEIIDTFKTPFGSIKGIVENGVVAIKNIRYAYSERFKMPIALEPNSEQLYISAKTPACPQNISSLLDKMIGSTNVDDFEPEESTQFLSIYRPQEKSDKPLSVIVWIHGGSYEIGCGDVDTADPRDWVKEHNILVVCLSYRLGIFGFLGGTPDRPANLGLFDMIEGLKWVKNYIQYFGGDSENITLFGQSSGADAIAHLMISKGTEGLFTNVILQSAPLGLRLNRLKMTQEFFQKTTHFSTKTDSMEMIESYKNLAPSFIKYGLKAAMPFGSQYGFPPLCEEDEALKRWQEIASKYNMLIGVNDEETAFYLRTSEIVNKYVPKKLINKVIRTTTEIIYGKPAEEFAQNYSNGGGNVFLFRIYNKTGHHFSAAHAFDLPLLFGNEKAWKSAGILNNIPWDYIHENGKQLRAIWAEFAKTGTISDETPRPEILELRKI